MYNRNGNNLSTNNQRPMIYIGIIGLIVGFITPKRKLAIIAFMIAFIIFAWKINGKLEKREAQQQITCELIEKKTQ